MHNGGVSASPIKYMNLCVREHVPADVDLVIIEYAVNQMLPDKSIAKSDPVQQYERLVRKLIRFPNRPAIILLQTFSWSRGFNRIAHNSWSSFFETPEDHFAVVAKYYGLPSLSLRDAIFHNVLRLERGYAISDVLGDCKQTDLDRNAKPEPGPGLCRHPNSFGHGLLANLTINYLIEAFDAIHADPSQNRPEPHWEIPIPMYNFNEPREGDKRCYRAESLHDIVVDKGGWEYIVEGTSANPKPGYAAYTPGKAITLQVDSRPASNMTAKHGADVLAMKISIGYLQSYEHMGKAALSCENCKCEPYGESLHSSKEDELGRRLIDAHMDLRESTLGMWFMKISEHAECRIKLETVEDTTSGEHKFKITNIVLGELPGEEVDGFYLQSEKQKSYVGVDDSFRR
ncbi:DNA polymerase alpha subunit B [Cymbomonas tetramitiformis]|uniref:DNA polymerase alpha subunit B n=1 Tax=Cymbomonas tetramitiformis TaxID=36881 RepID=A0AAE0LIX0_9CHLO|nr:DNA polymerase alpha subunit B [Cymbomonas tetramitiformis]